MEEALRCGGLAAVVAEIRELDFAASRRLQLAVEKTRLLGIVHRYRPYNLQANTFIARWTVKVRPSEKDRRMPGVGNPCWMVELQKIRNGKPSSWIVAWNEGFENIDKQQQAIISNIIQKAG